MARERGLAAHNGLGMLIHQAVLALEYFIGEPVDTAKVLPAARAALEQGSTGGKERHEDHI